MSDGFLGRWSKRKLEVKEGKAVEAEPVAALAPPSVPANVPLAEPSHAGQGSEQPPVAASVESAVPPPSAGEGAGGGTESESLPIPTLEDVKSLTAQSDFTRFTAPNVTPEVKNAALKKLFSDPHYNIMDGLDVYIDDYSQPDPMPDSMIRQLASVKFLNLFAREEKEEAEAEAARQGRDVANNPTAQTVAQSEAVSPEVPAAVPEPADHADPDLRLQQDHAAPGKDPGPGAG